MNSETSPSPPSEPTSRPEAAKPPSRATIGRAIGMAALVLVLLRMVAPAITLDAQYWYSPSFAVQLIRELGPAGRADYLVTALADLCFIAAYTRVIRLLWWRLSGLRQLPPAARAAIGFDLIETTGVLVMLGVFPDQPIALAVLVSVATPCKWVAFLLLGATSLVRWLLPPKS